MKKKYQSYLSQLLVIMLDMKKLKFTFNFGFLLLSMALLAGCNPNVKSGHDVYLQNNDSNLLIFNVANIEIVNEDLVAVGIGRENDISAREALINWMSYKLRAGGTMGKMKIVINKARLLRTPDINLADLNYRYYYNGREIFDKNISHTNRKDAYKGEYTVTVSFYDNDGIGSVKETVISVFNYKVIVGDTSLLDKKKIWAEQISELLQLIDVELRVKTASQLLQ